MGLEMIRGEGEKIMNRPGKLQAIVIMMLVDGVLNILWGLALMAGMASSIVGILCLPLTLYPIVLGILEIVYSSQALSGKGELSCRPLKWVAAMQIGNLIVGDLISPVIGIISLVFYESEEVRAYYEAPHS
jgi:hypothetical protein